MKSLLLKITIFLCLLIPVAAAQTALAADCTNVNTNQSAIQQGANGASGVTDCKSVDQANKEAASSLENTVKDVLNVLSLAVGILAVIMVVVSGFRYVTSSGKQENVQAAKSTLVYAVIGILIVAFSQAIIHFVLRNVQ